MKLLFPVLSAPPSADNVNHWEPEEERVDIGVRDWRTGARVAGTCDVDVAKKAQFGHSRTMATW